jgi:acyl-coenzyme A thioesterase PaaI-like protein
MGHRPALPPVFGAYFDALEEQYFATGPDDLFSHCFGCSRDNPDGLRVRCFKQDGGVVAPVIIERRHQGPPGAAHGGIVAAYLDEILGGAVIARVGKPGLTGELTVRYVKAVPTETPLLCRARAGAVYPKYVDVEATLEIFEGDGVVATARGRFFPR